MIPTRGEQVAITGLLPSVSSSQPQPARTTLLTLPPPTSCREYTPARSADKHLPEAHCRSASILSPAVTATGTTFCAAWITGTSSSEANRRQDLISAPGPVGVVFHVSMKN